MNSRLSQNNQTKDADENGSNKLNRTSQSKETEDADENGENKASNRKSVTFSVEPTPIFYYKPEVFNVKEVKRPSESVTVEIRAPDKIAHKKSMKVVLDAPELDKSGGDRKKGGIAKDFVFNLERIRNSSAQWGFPDKDVKPIIKGKDINKPMREALYGVKWKTPLSTDLRFDPYKVYNYGEPGCGSWRGVVQDFKKIRDYHLKKGTLFVDPLFPPTAKSVTFSGKIKDFSWTRPKKLTFDAKLFVKGFSRFDVRQGHLGDCWFLSAMGTLTQRHNLFLQVVPLDQSFTDKYAGIFHFRFWQYGRWIDVVIDDSLPVNSDEELLFTKSTGKNEYWPALVEKAYAKLHGSYEALSGGLPTDAMEDLTGGISEIYRTKGGPANLFDITRKAFARGSLISSGIGQKSKDSNDMGLVEGHSYSITRVLKTKLRIDKKSTDVELVRIRNPWGNYVKWYGAWSDRSKEWLLVSHEEKERVGLNFDDDGEFWMSFEDMCLYYGYVYICNLCPESSKRSKKWQVQLFEGEWVQGVTAGGCLNNKETFARNPQYLITLDEPDDKYSDTCTIVVNLMQKKKPNPEAQKVIGFVLYLIREPEAAPKPLDQQFLYGHQLVDYYRFECSRSVTKRFELETGTYCIIPSTYAPDENAEYLLRVFSERKVQMKENEEEIGGHQKKRICMCPPIETNESYTSIQYDGEDAKEESESESESEPELEPGLESEPESPPLKPKHRSEPPKIMPERPETPDDKDDIKSYQIISKDPKIQKDIEKTFLKLSGDDEEIAWEHLPKLLDIALRKSANHSPFDTDLCRCLVASYDENQSGKLFYEEFVKICKDIKTWNQIYVKHTTNKSPVLNGDQLRAVINEAGHSINNHLLNLITHRYGNGNGGMDYQSVLMCLIKLKTMELGASARYVMNSTLVEFTLDEFMNLVMYS